MTKLKTGDRVLPGRFEDGTNEVEWFDNKSDFIGKTCVIINIMPAGNYEIEYDDIAYIWPPSALTPVKPKWEPVVGKEVQFRYKDDPAWFKGTYVGLAGIGDGYCIKYTEGYYYQTKDIRPIAPSPEEEIGSILCKLIGGDNYILRDAKADIMALFNRNKEGEGR